MPKKSRPIPLTIPEPIPAVKKWFVLGIDPSLSRTGYALMVVDSQMATWVEVGSVKPESSKYPIWVRNKIICEEISNKLNGTIKFETDNSSTFNPETIGLIISTEFPTPRNDYLCALNREIHSVFLQRVYPICNTVRILTTNASTLRSVLGLTKTGAKNKKENIAKAYEFIDKDKFPSLDSDSCDGVLLAMMGRSAVSICLGQADLVPERFKNVLCDSRIIVKGKGRNERTIVKGLLHRLDYWYEYKPISFGVLNKDASSNKNKLNRKELVI